MNILILGGTGFLGLHCVKALSERHTVYNTGIPRSDIPDNNFISVKLSETERIISIIEDKHIDVVMHLVSSLLPNSTLSDYIADTKEVYFPTATLLEYCTKKKIRFAFFSSGGAIYGNSNGTFSEDLRCQPISYYGLSKLHIEQLITFYHAKGLEYLIIRPSNPYGPGQNIFGKQGLIAVMMGKILKKQPIEIWGDGSAVKDFIYIDDFVSFVVSLLEMPSAWNTMYNIGSGVGHTVNEVIEAFQKNSIPLPEISYIDTKVMDVSHMILNCTKINSIIKYSCRSIEEGIACFWHFQKEQFIEK